MPTRKERIFHILLESEEPLSPSEISRILGESVDHSVIIEDLKHLARSLKSRRDEKGKPLYDMIMVLPRCKKCGKEIHVPDIRIPSKCPYCGSQWIEEPRFKIKRLEDEEA